jgi:hypothetical protein
MQERHGAIDFLTCIREIAGLNSPEAFSGIPHLPQEDVKTWVHYHTLSFPGLP